MPESSSGVVEWSVGQGGASTTEHTVEVNAKIAADAYGAIPTVPGTIETWSDGTLWADGTGWTD